MTSSRTSPLIDEFDAWNPSCLPGRRCEPWRPAGEVHPPTSVSWASTPAQRDQLSINEDRACELNIVLVKCANVWVVANEHIAVGNFEVRSRVDRLDERPNDRCLKCDLKTHGSKGTVGQVEPVKKSDPRSRLVSLTHFAGRHACPRSLRSSGWRSPS